MAPLFACPPRIAVKLARCREVARRQCELSNTDLEMGYTYEDAVILHRRLGGFANILDRFAYQETLNA